MKEGAVQFISRMFGRSQPSGQVAKERLRQVLVQDRANVSPQLMEQLRTKLTRVLTEYMEVDDQNFELSINPSDRGVALVAHIGIRRMKRNAR